MPYWHEYNPWADRLVYVPLDEFVDVVYTEGTRVGISMHLWRSFNNRVDAYLLPNTGNNMGVPLNWISAGIRYGKQGQDYYSPFGDQFKLALLLNKYAERTDEVI